MFDATLISLFDDIISSENAIGFYKAREKERLSGQDNNNNSNDVDWAVGAAGPHFVSAEAFLFDCQNAVWKKFSTSVRLMALSN